MSASEDAKIDKLLGLTSGVIMIVGPTGSGKSSTMYTLVRELLSDRTNLITLEDPVEYHIKGATQVQINEKVGLTFASGLRSILRQDPDIICVGEIRDGETAEIAMSCYDRPSGYHHHPYRRRDFRYRPSSRHGRTSLSDRFRSARCYLPATAAPYLHQL